MHQLNSYCRHTPPRNCTPLTTSSLVSRRILCILWKTNYYILFSDRTFLIILWRYFIKRKYVTASMYTIQDVLCQNHTRICCYEYGYMFILLEMAHLGDEKSSLRFYGIRILWQEKIASVVIGGTVRTRGLRTHEIHIHEPDHKNSCSCFQTVHATYNIWTCDIHWLWFNLFNLAIRRCNFFIFYNNQVHSTTYIFYQKTKKVITFIADIAS